MYNEQSSRLHKKNMWYQKNPVRNFKPQTKEPEIYILRSEAKFHKSKGKTSLTDQLLVSLTLLGALSFSFTLAVSHQGLASALLLKAKGHW